MKTSTVALLISLSCNGILLGYILTRYQSASGVTFASLVGSGLSSELKHPTAAPNPTRISEKLSDTLAVAPQTIPPGQNDYWQKHMESAPALKMLRLQQGTSIDAEYQSLFARLKLTAARREILRHLLSERRAAEIELAMNASLLSQADLKELSAQNEAAFQTQVLQDLGKDVQGDITEFDSRKPDEAAAIRISRSAEVLGASLSSDDQEALAAILNAAGWAKAIGSASDEGALQKRADAVKLAIQSSNGMSADQKAVVLAALDEDVEMNLLRNRVYANQNN